MVGYVCLHLIWVLNPGTGSGISNNSYSLLLSGEEDMFPVWRRTAMLKINWKDSRWVKGDVQKNVDELSEPVMEYITLLHTAHIHFI